MEVDVFNMEGEKVRTLELPKAIFEASVNVDLIHQAYIRQMTNARLGTHDTKGRSEVSGGGRKPWRQKGTGRARQGSIRAPQWVGGGKVHTPHPRDYTQKMPRQMRRAALRSALTVKATEKGVVILEELSIPASKTKLMAQALNRIVGEASVLILLPDKTEGIDLIVRSVNNLPDVKTLLAKYLNIRDLMLYEKLVVPLAALDVLIETLG